MDQAYRVQWGSFFDGLVDLQVLLRGHAVIVTSPAVSALTFQG